MRPRSILALALVVVGFTTAACAEPATYVVLLVDVQPEALDGATRLRVEVAGLDGRVRRDETLSLADVTLPVRVPLTPEGGDAARGWLVDVTLLGDGDVVLGRARARGEYSRGVTAETSVCVHAGCAPVTCGPCDELACDTCRGSVCSSADVDLYAPGAAPRCPATCMARETACDNHVDEDCDGRIDCGDSDCPCVDASGPPDAGADGCTPTAESSPALCHDGLDNDCDTFVDCADSECEAPAESGTLCSNGIDDDCDGAVDCADTAGCARQSCGRGGYRCCAGECVDTWSNEANCGTCGIACEPTRSCVFVQGEMGRSGGGACRCGVDGDCADGWACESHDTQMVCNCPDDDACGPQDVGDPVARCRMQGAIHNSYCGY